MYNRNKIIFIILLIVVLALFAAQTTFFLLIAESSSYLLLGGLSVMELAVGIILLYFLKHPQYNIQYRIKKNNGKWKNTRIVYGPDPQGFRYLSMGISAVFLKIFFFFTILSCLFEERLSERTEILFTTLTTISIIPFIIAINVIERKIKKENPEENNEIN